jgi:2,3-bisphosphoglycerate-dependent phosphoglycerate mutase
MAAAPVRVLLVRHGETPWNADGRMQGALDVELNDTGRAQAAAVAAWLARHHGGDGGRVAAVVSSDLKRASATADAIGGALGLPVTLDPRLRETNLGVWQGHTWEQVVATFRDQVHAWKSDASYAMPDGESVRQRFARVTAALHEAALAAPPGGAVVVVAHGGVVDDAGRLVGGVPFTEATRLRKPNTCVCTLQFTPHAATAAALGGGDGGGDDRAAAAAAAVRAAFPPETAPATIEPATASTALGAWAIVTWGQLDHLTEAGLAVSVKPHRHTIGAPLSDDLARAAELQGQQQGQQSGGIEDLVSGGGGDDGGGGAAPGGTPPPPAAPGGRGLWGCWGGGGGGGGRGGGGRPARPPPPPPPPPLPLRPTTAARTTSATRPLASRW